MKMAADKGKYDLVVFGATGFTGQFVIEEVAKAANKEKEKGLSHIAWAIAGRNETKLRNSLAIAEKETGFDLSDVGLLVANVMDENSIDAMTKQAGVILNCVGPFHMYGRPIVEYCIKNGTDQVDICGEPQYVDRMTLEFNKEADAAGVHIVSCCGISSLPVDLGLCHLSKNFPGRLNSAKGFLHARGTIASYHTGTLESLSYAFSHLSEMRSLQTKLHSTKLQEPKYPKSKYFRFHKSTDASMWGLPFPSDDGPVYRSQRYLYENTELPFVQYQGFMGNSGMLGLVGLSLGIAYLYCVSFFSCSKNFLFKHPDTITAGAFTKEGPSRTDLKKFDFGVKIVGEGWKEKLPKKEDQYTEPPNHKMILDIYGTDPAYGSTAIMLVAAAMTLLREKESCSERGGVMSPGMAFFNTNIIQRLTESGLSIGMRDM